MWAGTEALLFAEVLRMSLTPLTRPSLMEDESGIPAAGVLPAIPQHLDRSESQSSQSVQKLLGHAQDNESLQGRLEEHRPTFESEATLMSISISRSSALATSSTPADARLKTGVASARGSLGANTQPQKGRPVSKSPSASSHNSHSSSIRTPPVRSGSQKSLSSYASWKSRRGSHASLVDQLSRMLSLTKERATSSTPDPIPPINVMHAPAPKGCPQSLKEALALGKTGATTLDQRPPIRGSKPGSMMPPVSSSSFSSARGSTSFDPEFFSPRTSAGTNKFLAESMRPTPSHSAGNLSSRTSGGGCGTCGTSSKASIGSRIRASCDARLSSISKQMSTNSIGMNGRQEARSPNMGRLPSYRRCWAKCMRFRKKLAPDCRWLLKTKTFQGAMFFALLSALFLPDLWILVDRPHNNDLDVLLTFVLFLFIGELVVQSIGLMRTYWGSFFFWMDCIGACSLLVDLSYFPLMELLQGGEKDVSNNVIIMRAARIAKLGARAGRFTKLVKLLRFLPGMSQDTGRGEFTAKVIYAKLIMALSTRVSCLIIIMVMVMPFFSFWSFPEQDWSMMAWMNIVESAAGIAEARLDEQVRLFELDYRERQYYPYLLTASVPGLTKTYVFRENDQGPPARQENILRMTKGGIKCEFNFTRPKQMDAAMNMALVCFIMVLMLMFSLQMSFAVSRIVLRPLESLLKQVKEAANSIFKSVTDMAEMVGEESQEVENDSIDSERGEVHGFQSETALLEKVVEKLAVLGTLMVQKDVNKEDLMAMSENDRQMIDQYRAARCETRVLVSKSTEDLEGGETMDIEGLLAAQRAMIQSAGLSLEIIDSWNFNPLEVDKARCHAAAMFFLGPHNHGVEFDPLVMSDFLRACEANYGSVPYHSWFHAVDVTHAVYRMMHLLRCEAFLSGQERFSVLASAISHDLGHHGFNNPFLVETSHELALRYNDRSPLENMHCARLFEIVALPRTNIFAALSRKEYQDARKMCIEAIMHTDAKRHFDMVKDVQLLYEVNSDLLGESRSLYSSDPKDFPVKEVVECFRQIDTRQLLRKLVLHTADISNPMKPFRICRIWAWKILEEMFTQGDKELELGIPVQSLNDRDKVNRAFSQVGFIEFLVAPLAFAFVKVLPPFEICLEQLIENMKRWQEIWVSETQPKDEEKKAAEERVAKLERRFIEGL